MGPKADLKPEYHEEITSIRLYTPCNPRSHLKKIEYCKHIFAWFDKVQSNLALLNRISNGLSTFSCVLFLSYTVKSHVFKSVFNVTDASELLN
jgi:hypothetical protein